MPSLHRFSFRSAGTHRWYTHLSLTRTGQFRYPVTVMARSVFLRGFDPEIAEQIVGFMERHGTRFIRSSVPKKFEKLPNGKVRRS